MIIEIINGITRLTASDGMVLTNGMISGTEVWMSPQDSASNWRETADPPEELDPENIISELEGLI